MTPCTWSLVQIFMGRAMATLSLPGLRGYGIIGGRFYLDMSMSAAASAAVGVSERRFRTLTENTFGRLPAGVRIPPVALSRARRAAPAGADRRAIRPRGAPRRPAPPRLPGREPAALRGADARVATTSDPAALARLWDEELRPLVETGSAMLAAAGRSDPLALLTVQSQLRSWWARPTPRR